MALENQTVRDAILRLHESIQKTSGYLDDKSESLPWHIVRTDEEDGIYVDSNIVHDHNLPMLNEDQEYVTIMHPRTGEKVANLLSKLDQHIGAGMAYSTAVVQAMLDLANELLRNINEESESAHEQPSVQ